MLRSWRDEVRVSFSPERVAFARVSRRWQPKLNARHAVQVEPGAASDWRPCIGALQEGLQGAQWADAAATVILSNHYVRYALVPWSEHLAAEEEKRAWVAHHFSDLYGEAPEGAEYRWSEEKPNAPCIAAAIDSEFVSAIRAAFAATSLKLHSIQPYLMAAFNRCRQQVKAAPSWALFPEPGRVCLAATANEEWKAVTSKNIGVDWSDELSLLLERQIVLADETPAVVLAYAPETPGLTLDVRGDITLRMLPPRALAGYSPQSDRDYAMALTGRI